MFHNKTLLITGGTGSFGNAVLDRFLTTDIKEIRIFSRDELKQDNMRHFYQQNYPEYSDKLKFYIGDVRQKRNAQRRLYFPRCSFKTSTLLRVLSGRSRKDQCAWHRERFDGRD